MKFILINKKRNIYTTVDDVDFNTLIKFKWYFRKDGYVRRQERSNGKIKEITMHRQLMQVADNLFVDHINGNKLDNRRSNLRICTKAENVRNKVKSSKNTSGYKGIWWHKQNKKWIAEIGVDGKKISLGSYVSIIDAVKAYNKAALKYHKKFAKLNEVN
jgi:hypothetical protein